MLPILIPIAVAAAIGAFVWNRNKSARAAIAAELARHRVTDVVIASDWLDFDRGTLTYDVTYTDRAGRRLTNRCKVAIAPAADRSLFWKDPLPLNEEL
jgi:hypothetical protein